MTDIFDRALGVVLHHEGYAAFTDDPQDPGGPTKWGVSLRTLKSLPKLAGDIDRDGDVDIEDIKTLTRDDAVRLIYRPLWNRHKYDRITDATIAIKAFDFTVNMGSRRYKIVRVGTRVSVGGSNVLLQWAVRAATGVVLVPDGYIGPKSIAAINAAPSRALLAAYKSEAAGYYRSLNKERFIRGWLNRAYS